MSRDDWMKLANLKQITALSIHADDMDMTADPLCMLCQLRQQYLKNSTINITQARKIGRRVGLNQLVSFILVSKHLDLSLVPTIIENFSALKTLIFIRGKISRNEKLDGSVHLSNLKREQPINVFVSDIVYNYFIDLPVNVRLISLSHNIIDCLRHYTATDEKFRFLFPDELCSNMV